MPKKDLWELYNQIVPEHVDPVAHQLKLSADPELRQQQLLANNGYLLKRMTEMRSPEVAKSASFWKPDAELEDFGGPAAGFPDVNPEFFKGMVRPETGGEAIAQATGESFDPTGGGGKADIQRDLAAVLFGPQATGAGREMGRGESPQDVEEYFRSRELTSRYDPRLSEAEKSQVETGGVLLNAAAELAAGLGAGAAGTVDELVEVGTFPPPPKPKPKPKPSPKPSPLRSQIQEIGERSIKGPWPEIEPPPTYASHDPRAVIEHKLRAKASGQDWRWMQGRTTAETKAAEPVPLGTERGGLSPKELDKRLSGMYHHAMQEFRKTGNPVFQEAANSVRLRMVGQRRLRNAMRESNIRLGLIGETGSPGAQLIEELMYQAPGKQTGPRGIRVASESAIEDGGLAGTATATRPVASPSGIAEITANPKAAAEDLRFTIDHENGHTLEFRLAEASEELENAIAWYNILSKDLERWGKAGLLEPDAVLRPSFKKMLEDASQQAKALEQTIIKNRDYARLHSDLIEASRRMGWRRPGTTAGRLNNHNPKKLEPHGLTEANRNSEWVADLLATLADPRSHKDIPLEARQLLEPWFGKGFWESGVSPSQH